jgi:hypothetical protein
LTYLKAITSKGAKNTEKAAAACPKTAAAIFILRCA